MFKQLISVIQASAKAKVIASVVAITAVAAPVTAYEVIQEQQQQQQEATETAGTLDTVSGSEEADATDEAVEDVGMEKVDGQPAVESDEETTDDGTVEEEKAEETTTTDEDTSVESAPTPASAPAPAPTPALTPAPTPEPEPNPMFKPYPDSVLFDYKTIGVNKMQFRVNRFGIEDYVNVDAVKHYVMDDTYADVYVDGVKYISKMPCGGISLNGGEILVAFGTKSYLVDGKRWSKPSTYRVHLWAEQGDWSLVKGPDRPAKVEITDITFSTNEQGFVD